MNLLIAIFLALMTFTLNAEMLMGKVVRIADGDTITVLDGGNVQHKIRLEKIDAPEKGQAFGNVSKKHLGELVAGKGVKVEWTKKDKYGRILGVVYVGDVNANLEMIKAGLAWHYKHFDNTEAYALAESEARGKKLGLWVDPNPVPPWEFRKMKKQIKGAVGNHITLKP